MCGLEGEAGRAMRAAAWPSREVARLLQPPPPLAFDSAEADSRRSSFERSCFSRCFSLAIFSVFFIAFSCAISLSCFRRVCLYDRTEVGVVVVEDTLL